MGTNMMQHKKSVLFLVSLSKRTIKEIENKGVDYQFFMRTIRGYSHVEFHDTISEQLISTAPLYRVVVIIGHQVNRCIELSDGSLFPMQKIVSALPASFNGYLHVAVCGSSIVKLAIKERCPNSKVRTSPETTQLELQFHIYSQLLSHTDLSKENFSDWYNNIRRNIMEEQGRKNPTDLAKLPCATKLGEDPSEDVKTTVYSPRRVVRGERFSIFIAMHFDADNGTLFFNKRNNDPRLQDEDPRELNVVLNNVHYGDELSIKISFEDANDKPTELIYVIDNNPQHVKINDKIVPLEFRAFVDAEYPCSYFTTILEYIKDGHCLKKFDYHRYGFESVYPQYNYKLEGRQVSIGGSQNKLVRYAEPFSPQKGDKIEKRVLQAMRKVVEDGLIENKQDWAAVYIKIRNEKIFYSFTIAAFVKLIKSQEFSSEIVPQSGSNIEKLAYYNSKKGQWLLYNRKYEDEDNRLIKLADIFFDYYQKQP